MRAHDEENWLEDAFREEPKAAPARPVAKGDEGDWLEEAFNDAAPARRGMSTAMKVAVGVAIVVALVLMFLLGRQLLDMFWAFATVSAA